VSSKFGLESLDHLLPSRVGGGPPTATQLFVLVHEIPVKTPWALGAQRERPPIVPMSSATSFATD
jgi:hypothetical protein